MNDVLIERAIAIFGMCLWLVFPIGLFVSIIRQARSSRAPLLNNGLYQYAFFGEEDSSSKEKPAEPEKKKERDDSYDDEENGILHYLKGREKLHEQDNHEELKK